MKTNNALIVLFTLLSIVLNGWVGICYAARNTYFRPIAFELDEARSYRYQFRDHVEHKEANPKQRYYFMAAELGGLLARDIYIPATLLNGLSLVLIWSLGWNRRKCASNDRTIDRKP